MTINFSDVHEIDCLYDGHLLGCYVKGHVPVAELWSAIQELERETHYFKVPEGFSEADVKHGWWRKVPREDGYTQIHEAKPGSRGAFRATYIDFDTWER